MSTSGGHDSEAATEELREEVEQARRDLGDTVEALAAKTDIKSRATDTARQVAAKARERAREAASAQNVRALAWRGSAMLAVAGAIGFLAVLIRGRDRETMRRGRHEQASRHAQRAVRAA